MSDLGTPSATRPQLRIGRVGRIVRGRGAPGAARLRLRRPRRRTLVLLALATALLLAGGYWLRDSSLVAVRNVDVTGVSGAQASEIRQALEEAAGSMTTLHVREDALRTAVEPFSIVKGIEVSTDFPRGMRIHVVSNVAVGAVELGGRATPVTADGTLLRDVTAASNLPSVPLHGSPVGSRLREGEALTALAALGAAPPALRTRVESVKTTSANGLELQLSNGPAIWFGDGDRLLAKWAATAAVIADPEAAGASYVDVTAPSRPAVGGLPEGAPATGESDAAVPPPGIEVDPATGAAIDPQAAGTPDSTVETTP